MAETDKERTDQQPSGVLSTESRARYENAMRDWVERLEADAEEVRASERLAEGDFAIRINARD